MDERLETPACPICSEASAFSTWFERDATVIGIAYRHALVRCATCSFVFVRPRIKPSIFLEYYKGYYSGDVSSFANEHREGDTLVAQRILGRLERHGLARGARLLEVGCGTGGFLEAAARAGYVPSGLEPSPHAVRYAKARGLDVTEGGLDAATYPAESFDAAVLIQTLEHLPQPRAALERVRSLVRPGGLVAVEVPNVANVFTTWSRRLGRVDRTNTLEPGDHYSYFTGRTLAEALRRAGWTPLETDAGFHAGILGKKLPGPLAWPVARLSRALDWGMSVLALARR